MPKNVIVAYIDGVIDIQFNFSTSEQCTSPKDPITTIQFILGFTNGNGGSLYSEKNKLKEYSSDGSYEGLPQTIGTTTISFKPGTGYVLTNL